VRRAPLSPPSPCQSAIVAFVLHEGASGVRLLTLRATFRLSFLSGLNKLLLPFSSHDQERCTYSIETNWEGTRLSFVRLTSHELHCASSLYLSVHETPSTLWKRRMDWHKGNCCLVERRRRGFLHHLVQDSYYWFSLPHHKRCPSRGTKENRDNYTMDGGTG